MCRHGVHVAHLDLDGGAALLPLVLVLLRQLSRVRRHLRQPIEVRLQPWQSRSRDDEFLDVQLTGVV